MLYKLLLITEPNKPYNKPNNKSYNKLYNKPYNKPCNKPYNKPFNKPYNKPFNKPYNNSKNSQNARSRHIISLPPYLQHEDITVHFIFTTQPFPTFHCNLENIIICSFICSFIYSFICSFICSFIYSFVRCKAAGRNFWPLCYVNLVNLVVKKQKKKDFKIRAPKNCRAPRHSLRPLSRRPRLDAMATYLFNSKELINIFTYKDHNNALNIDSIIRYFIIIIIINVITYLA